MQIEYQSDVGRRRNTNQDYASVFTNQAGIKLAVLADGMGGHRAGDIASQMAVTNLGTAWENLSLSDDEKEHFPCSCNHCCGRRCSRSIFDDGDEGLKRQH